MFTWPVDLLTPSSTYRPSLFVPGLSTPRPTKVAASCENKSPPWRYCHVNPRERPLYDKEFVREEVQSGLGSPTNSGSTVSK